MNTEPETAVHYDNAVSQNFREPVSPPPALEADGIYKSFRKSRRQELQVLDGLSLAVQPGEFVSIIGPSGSGKSTLFHIIGGLTKPEAGSIRMNGAEVTGRKGLISYMPQQPALFPWRTVEDNILLPRELAGSSREASREEAARWIKRAGLGGFEKAHPHTLSGGMQQRAAFLRAMMGTQDVLCLDEPFSALDALTRSDMQRWLLDLWEENRRTVLMITHHIEEALLLSDTVYVMTDRPGRVIRKFDVPFSRPRGESLVADPVFLALKQEISELLRDKNK